MRRGDGAKPNDMKDEDLIEAVRKTIEQSPTRFMYMLDRAIKTAHVGGSSIDKVQRYYIKCLLKSNESVLTEPVHFKPL